MKMEESLMEMEEVKIGAWKSSLPSDICTNRQIFNDIFSINTWNNVLSQEQKQRLVQMLPKEIRCNSEASKETIEDLFNGSLTLFSHSPLENFFNQLESGQFDPIVTDMKAGIKKELRKESLRQLKDYHTKLLEDIVVSRQKHLNRLKAHLFPIEGSNTNKNSSNKPARTRNSTAKPKAKSKKQAGVLQNASSELNTKLSNNTNTNSGGGKPKNTKLPAQKPILKAEENGKEAHHNTLPTTPIPATRKRKGKEDPKDFTDGGKPLSKKPANIKPKLMPNSSPVPEKEKLSDNSKLINCQSQTTDGKTQKILNSSSVSSLSANSSKVTVAISPAITTTTNPQTRFVSQLPTESILSAALTGDKLPKSSAETVIYTSPTKSSPILASHLQASSQVSVKVEDSLGLFNNDMESESSCRITLNYHKLEEKSSDDDLETSSDEFEAIQPTIGFGTALPTSTLSGMFNSSTMSKVVLSTGNVLQTVSSSSSTSMTSTPISGRIVQVQTTQQQDSVRSLPPMAVTVSTSGIKPQSNPIYIVSTTKSLEAQQQQSRIIQLSKDPTKLTMSSQQLAIMNNSKILVKGSTADQQFLQKIAGAGQSQEVIRISNADLLNAKSSGGVHYLSTSTGKNLILHPLNTSSPNVKTISSGNLHSNIQQQNIPTSFANLNFATSHSDVGGLHFVTAQSNQQLKPNDSLSSQNSSTLMDNDELNLSLSSLGSLGIGMNISNISVGSLDGMIDPDNLKMEMDVIDKIDDLSVLDGNPFDSIPNLSDELDGLDLDLVDGLCDFEVLLSDEKKYPSFFSLIRDVLCSTRDHRMNLMCLEKTVRKWATSSGATMNPWYLRISDWNNALLTALNFLAGMYPDVHPEDFVPYIEYKYKTKYYQWIGAGRDGDNNLTPLCDIWIDNTDRLPSVKKLDGETEDQEEEDEENEDSELTGEDAKKKNKRPITPPPPRFVTDWTVRPSSEEEKALFRQQERSRFDNPHKAFTYNMHGYESVVGPVKGVYSSQVGITNKARGHSLLVDDRPPYVTILALVRDAVARLPNGEGTRSEICEMLRDSAFLAPDASSVTLNSVVSGALDRLHYERDPCVRYDSHKKSWIYLHRDRTQDQFERLHHNRSYTKSTKSRNNTSRKSRRSTAKGQNSGSSVGGGNMNSTASSTSSSTATLEASCTDEEQIVVASSIASPSTPVASTAPQLRVSLASVCSEEPEAIVSTPSTIPNLTSNFKILEASTIPSQSATTFQNLRLTPSSVNIDSTQTNDNAKTTCTTSASPRIFQPQQYIVQTSSSSMIPGATHNTIQIHAARPLQISNPPSSASVVETVPSTQRPVPSVTTNQGQMVFAPQTMLRLANALRLSQVRVPGTNSSLAGHVRMPQHRILLTRGAIPGQNQTQGILLGQTSSGQTVILSTAPPGSMGGFQALQSMATVSTGGQFHLHDNSIVTVSSIGSENTTSTPSQSPTMSNYSIKPMASNKSNASTITSTATTAGSQTLNVGNSVFDMNSPKMLQLNIAGGSALLKSGVVTSASSGTMPVTVSFSGHSHTTTSLAGIHSQRHPVGYTIATVRGNTMSLHPNQPSGAVNRTIGGSSIQLQALGQNQISPILGQQPTIIATTDTDQHHTGSQGQTMTSPIIIRSVQGDLTYGHIALGKGVQGIKLIPFPMGNKTVLAKIIPPNSTPVSSSSITRMVTAVTENATTTNATIQIATATTNQSNSSSSPSPAQK